MSKPCQIYDVFQIESGRIIGIGEDSRLPSGDFSEYADPERDPD